MRKLILCLIMVSTITLALSPTPADVQSETIVYRNAIIHVGNGEVIENGTLAFENGKITRIGKFKDSWKESDIDLKGKHIYPGFILPNTNLGINEVGSIRATKDDTETGQNNANVRSIVAYNTDSEITPTLKFNGILLAQSTPRGGLVSGLSSIVQLDAWNWEDAAVKVDDGIHVNWPSPMKAEFDFSTFTVKMVKNKNYQEQLKIVTSLFEDARSNNHKLNNQVNLKLDAVSPVFNGSRAVYVHTDNSKSIVTSINYFKGLGVKNLVLVTGQSIEPVIGFVKQSGVPVIVASTHDLPDRQDSSVDDGYTTAIKLHKAGILVGLGYQSTMSSRNLAFTAGTLVNYGMEKEQALKLITENTAKILRINDVYGSLAVGKSATLFITNGDALDMRSNVLEAAYIDGRNLNLVGRQQELNERFLDKYNL